MGFFDRFRPKEQTIDELRIRCADAEREREHLHREIEEMAARQGGIIIDGTAAEADAFMHTLADKQRNHAALETVAATLRQRIDAAEKAEAARALTAEFDAYKREVAEVTALMRDEYPRLATAIAAIAERESRISRWVGDLGSRLDAAARAGLIPHASLPTMPLTAIGGVGHLFEQIQLPDTNGHVLWPAPLDISTALAAGLDNKEWGYPSRNLRPPPRKPTHHPAAPMPRIPA